MNLRHQLFYAQEEAETYLGVLLQLTQLLENVDELRQTWRNSPDVALRSCAQQLDSKVDRLDHFLELGRDLVEAHHGVRGSQILRAALGNRTY